MEISNRYDAKRMIDETRCDAVMMAEQPLEIHGLFANVLTI